MKLTKTLMAGLASVAIAGSAQAVVMSLGVEIGIDFGAPVNGDPAPGVFAGGFNEHAQGTTNTSLAAGLVKNTAGDFVDGVSVISTSMSFANSDPVPTVAQIANLTALGFDAAHLGDFSGGSEFVVFLNLDPAFTYKVEVISLFNGRDLAPDVIVNGVTQTIDTTSDNPIATFNNVVLANPGGEPNSINIQVDSADVSVYNALRITAVPEPSSTALLGLGGLALILRRRK